MLRQFIAWYLGIGFVIFIAVMVRGYWEGRPEKPIPHKVALTIGWFYLFINVNQLIVGEPVDSTGWLNPTHVVSAVFIAFSTRSSGFIDCFSAKKSFTLREINLQSANDLFDPRKDKSERRQSEIRD